MRDTLRDIQRAGPRKLRATCATAILHARQIARTKQKQRPCLVLFDLQLVAPRALCPRARLTAPICSLSNSGATQASTCRRSIGSSACHEEHSVDDIAQRLVWALNRTPCSLCPLQPHLRSRLWRVPAGHAHLSQSASMRHHGCWPQLGVRREEAIIEQKRRTMQSEGSRISWSVVECKSVFKCSGGDAPCLVRAAE